MDYKAIKKKIVAMVESSEFSSLKLAEEVAHLPGAARRGAAQVTARGPSLRPWRWRLRAPGPMPPPEERHVYDCFHWRGVEYRSGNEPPVVARAAGQEHRDWACRRSTIRPIDRPEQPDYLNGVLSVETICRAASRSCCNERAAGASAPKIGMRPARSTWILLFGDAIIRTGLNSGSPEIPPLSCGGPAGTRASTCTPGKSSPSMNQPTGRDSRPATRAEFTRRPRTLAEMNRDRIAALVRELLWSWGKTLAAGGS